VLVDESEPALLCQPGIGMAMHVCVRSRLGSRTSTRSGLTPDCQLNNLLRQNSKAKVAALVAHVEELEPPAICNFIER
jgi:hypothetical protein